MKKIITIIIVFTSFLAMGQGNPKVKGVRYSPISAPSNPTEGQTYYDSTAKVLYFYNGTAWISTSGNGGGTTYTAGTGLALNTSEFSLDPLLTTKLGLITVSQAIDLDNDVVKIGTNEYVKNTEFLSSSIRVTRGDNTSTTYALHGDFFEYADNLSIFTNFTPTSNFISGALLGIDNALGAMSGGGGDVTASVTFGNDNRVIRSDGSGKGVQSTDVVITDASLMIAPAIDVSSLTINGASSQQGGSIFSWLGSNYYTTTAANAFRWIPTDTESTPAEGMVYADDSENRPKYYDGTSWKNFLLDGDVASSVSSVLGQTGAVTFDTDDISQGSTNLYATSAEKAKIANAVAGTVAGRTGTSITEIISQTAAQIAADGAIGTGKLVFCSDCTPMAVQTTTTFNVDEYRGIDDRTGDSATYTFQNLEAGAIIEIEINRATDASYSGITFLPWPKEGTFSANTEQLVWIKILPSNRAIRKYIDLE